MIELTSISDTNFKSWNIVLIVKLMQRQVFCQIDFRNQIR